MSGEIDERDRLTFWRGWWNTARKYPPEQRLAWYDAVLAFAFDGEEPPDPAGDLTAAIAAGAVESVRSTIAISRKRREIGSRGGSKRQAKAKQKPSKQKAKRKQNGSKNQANPNQDQDQVQEQDQDQDHNGKRLKGSTATRQPPPISQFITGGELAGVPADFARQLHKDLVEAGWRDATGAYVANWRRYLKSAWNAEQKKICAARADGIGGFRIAR